jgi:hypothetical protein
VLEADSPNSVDMIGRPHIKILVPRADVKCVNRTVQLQVGGKPGHQIKTNSFNVHHRFQTLEAVDIASRLQLAALYTATSTLLPEPRTTTTGAELAVDLLRQCWVNHPLAVGERHNLTILSQLCGRTAPLGLLCADLHRSSEMLGFLYPDYETTSPSPSVDAGDMCLGSPLVNADASTEYHVPVPPRPTNGRLRLTPEEEKRSIGRRIQHDFATDSAWYSVALGKRIMEDLFAQELCIAECRVAHTLPAIAEGKVLALTHEVPSPSICLEQFPVALKHSRKIGQSMLEELKESYNEFARLPQYALSMSAKEIHAKCIVMRQNVSLWLQELETYLLGEVSLVPVAETNRPKWKHWHACGFRALRAANNHPFPSVRDLIRCTWDPSVLRNFNPFLSCDAIEQLRKASFTWQQSCVMQDRLDRILARTCGVQADDAANQSIVIRELRVQREWDVREHAEWLAFEVEGGIQIRPEQYSIIKDLMSNPGSISQLNMGEGKTRVIVPCLVLAWAKASATKDAPILRLNFLPQLIDEAFDHLHSKLCASVLSRKLFRVPLHRIVKLTPRRIELMRNTLVTCQRVGGAIVVAPEHRLSLQLRISELQLRMSAAPLDQPKPPEHSPELLMRGLLGLELLPFTDILDECDEILHHRKQLVYAEGKHQALPSFGSRVGVIQAVLHVIRHDEAISRFLRDPMVAVTHNSQAHAFGMLQLLPSARMVELQDDFHYLVMQALFKSPTLHLTWLRERFAVDLKMNIMKTVLSVKERGEAWLKPSELVDQSQFDDVMILRGLLAHGVLVHCLQKRHNVDFGIARKLVNGKRVAVPFIAADTPSLRSEFAHHDCALLYTTLSYYIDGLSSDQLKRAVDTLLGLEENEQRKTYDAWFAASAPSIKDDKTRSSVDVVAKLDTTNDAQLETLMVAFKHNMLVINFWLEYCVLPEETAVFPERLLGTPWQLTYPAAPDCKYNVVGFSGTNDTTKLLPLSVEQKESSLPSLQATNGKMLNHLVNKAIYKCIPKGSGITTTKSLVSFAIRHNLDALVDVGAQMAGLDNEQVADLVLAQISSTPMNVGSKYKGVVYFDVKERKWKLKALNKHTWMLHASPIAEHDAFVFYDESRCRGADLKLRKDAVALLTISPKMCKSALMQAAGRLRGLDHGQTMILAATPEIDAMIRTLASVGTGPVTMHHVLEFVTSNSMDACSTGIAAWVTQGMYFATKRGLPLSEVADPTGLYAAANLSLTVDAFARSWAGATPTAFV